MSSKIIVVWLTIITIAVGVALYSACLTYSQFKESETLAKGHDSELFLKQLRDVTNGLIGQQHKVLCIEIFLNKTSNGDYLKHRIARGIQ